MKKKSIIISTIVLLVLPALLVAGCQKAPTVPPDTFNAAYQFAEEGRSIRISGNSYGNPSAKSEYQLKINNGPDRWQGEYYILLLDSDSVVKEISHKVFDLPGGGGIQQPVMVEFPAGFTGALGLCVLIPQRGNLIATLSVGSKDAVATGWPDITNYSDWKITSPVAEPTIRVLPDTGEFLANSQNVSSQVLLEEAMVSQGPSSRQYSSAAYPVRTINVNDIIVVVTGRIQNQHLTNSEIAMYAEGYDDKGKQVAWTLDAAHIVGQIGLELGRNESGRFVLHLNASKDIESIRIFANTYAETPP